MVDDVLLVGGRKAARLQNDTASERHAQLDRWCDAQTGANFRSRRLELALVRNLTLGVGEGDSTADEIAADLQRQRRHELHLDRETRTSTTAESGNGSFVWNVFFIVYRDDARDARARAVPDRTTCEKVEGWLDEGVEKNVAE